MRAEAEIAILVGFFFGGAAFGAYVSEGDIQMDQATWLSALATLVAAFLGAWSAFKLQDRSRQREERKQNIAAGNRALFNLLRQSNSLKLIQRDYLDEHRDHPGRHLMIMPLPLQSYEDLNFDLRELAFMAEPKHQDLLFKLTIEEARYAEAIKTMNMQSEFRSQVRAVLSKAGIKHGEKYSGEDLKVAMGDFAYHQLKSLIDALYFHVDRTIESTIEVKNDLRDALKELYPDAKFLDFEPVDHQ